MPTHEHIEALQELQARRKFYIRLVNMQLNAASALVRRALGWRADGEDRDKIKTAALRIVANAMKGKPAELPFLANDLEVVRRGVGELQKARTSIEKDMQDIARTLPAWSAFGEGVAGFGALGLAVVVGEAGDLSAYANPAKLWKRFGLAPYKGKACSTHRRESKLSAEEWTALGYAPRRRAEIFAVIGDPLFKHAKKNGYRVIYDARRQHTATTHSDWTKAHSHNDAMRIMTKRFCVDLWSSWRQATGRMKPSQLLPAAEISEPAKARLKPISRVPVQRWTRRRASGASIADGQR